MSPAEFDTRRRLLGLSVQEAADWCGVQRRTVERWGSGYSDVSDAAVERLERLEDAMQAAVDRALSVAREKQSDTVTLLRYRSQTALDASQSASGLPLGAHAMLIGWIADAIEADGVPVEIEWGPLKMPKAPPAGASGAK